jgi:hypothetical protein
MDTPPVNCICTLILTVEGSIALESEYVKSTGLSVDLSGNVTKLTACSLFSQLAGWAQAEVALTAIAR